MPRKITKEDYYKWTQHSLTFFGIAAWLMKEAFKYMWLPTASNKMTLNWTTLTELYLPIRLIFIIVAHFQLVIHFCWVTHSPLVFRFASQVEFDRPIFTVGLNFILPNHIHFHRTNELLVLCILASTFHNSELLCSLDFHAAQSKTISITILLATLGETTDLAQRCLRYSVSARATVFYWIESPKLTCAQPIAVLINWCPSLQEIQR